MGGTATRIQDRRAAYALGAPSQVGAVKTSRGFTERADAEREAQAWNDSGDWDAVVIEESLADRT